MAYVQITSAQVDADSPVDETLMDTIRLNFDAIVTAGTGKIITDGVVEGSITALAVTEGKLGANAVAVGKLKVATLTGSFTARTALGGATAGTSLGNSYCHLALGSCQTSNQTIQVTMGSNISAGAQGVYIDGFAAGTYTCNYTVYYHSASPPHRIAGELWGTFLYLLRRKSDGAIIHHQWSPDPVWNRSGLDPFRKDDPRNAELLPHPWISHDLTGLEVVLLDTRADAVELVPYSETLAKHGRSKRTGLLRPEEELDEADVHDFKAISRAEADHWFAMHTGRDPFERLRSIAEKASQQAKLGGKPLLLGAKNFDQNVTIVTA